MQFASRRIIGLASNPNVREGHNLVAALPTITFMKPRGSEIVFVLSILQFSHRNSPLRYSMPVATRFHFILSDTRASSEVVNMQRGQALARGAIAAAQVRVTML